MCVERNCRYGKLVKKLATMHKNLLSTFCKVDNIGQFICKRDCIRGYATVQKVSKECNDTKMFAWQIHSYGGLEELQLSKTARIPHIKRPNDVLIQVSASSVNPIDIAMMGKRKLHVLTNLCFTEVFFFSSLMTK
jgi:hypothetical protein